ncbi:MAG: amidase [Actinomycetes bacterium]
MDSPWLDDASSLLLALRSGEISPVEATEASITAMDASSLNAISHLDAEHALETARRVDTSLPLAGLPIGIKELDHVAGWPANEASLALEGEIASGDSPLNERLRSAGAILLAQTTSSEFGSVNFTSTRIHGTTTNPWDETRTPGGSSGGSAAAVSGGLLPLCTGSDGGGSIRIPAGFCGLVGLKPSFGRIPKMTNSAFEPLTSVWGCLSRSIRDSALFLDVAAGPDERDPFSLPSPTHSFLGQLGTTDLTALRVGISIDLGTAFVADDVAEHLERTALALVEESGMTPVALDLALPQGGLEWSMMSSASVLESLGDRYPGCADQLGPEMGFGARLTHERFGLEGLLAVERFRHASVEAMAMAFSQVDVIICATNPDVAFDAAGPMRTVVGGHDLVAELGFGRALSNNGALTIPANTTGNPAIALPAGTVRGMPVSLQVIGRHHAEQVLLDIGLVLEAMAPWPMVAPGVAR